MTLNLRLHSVLSRLVLNPHIACLSAMVFAQGLAGRFLAESSPTCSSSRPSCSYPIVQLRSSTQQRGHRASRGVRLDTACSAATPAQLDSAKAQDNGVGKAQAGEYL